MEITSEMRDNVKAILPEKYDSLPDIDLYMDQLLEYITRTPISISGDEKLTSSMVNNYIKSGVIPRANGKRYSKEHIADLSMIIRLKQVLSINDTGFLMDTLKNTDEHYYDTFRDALSDELISTSKRVEEFNGSKEALALQLAIASYISQVACQELISDISTKNKEINK